MTAKFKVHAGDCSPLVACQKSMASGRKRKFSRSIFSAASRGSIEGLRCWIASGKAVDTQDPATGRTPLMHACLQRHRHVAEYILEINGNVNLPDNSGTTPLMIAVQKADIELVSLLLSYGASTKSVSTSGHTAISLCNRRCMTKSEYGKKCGKLKIISSMLRRRPPLRRARRYTDPNGKEFSSVCHRSRNKNSKIFEQNGFSDLSSTSPLMSSRRKSDPSPTSPNAHGNIATNMVCAVKPRSLSVPASTESTAAMHTCSVASSELSKLSCPPSEPNSIGKRGRPRVRRGRRFHNVSKSMPPGHHLKGVRKQKRPHHCESANAKKLSVNSSEAETSLASGSLIARRRNEYSRLFIEVQSANDAELAPNSCEESESKCMSMGSPHRKLLQAIEKESHMNSHSHSSKTCDTRPSSRQAKEDLHDFLHQLQLLHYMDDLLEMGVRRVRDLRFVTKADLEGLMKRIEKRKFLKASAALKTPVPIPIKCAASNSVSVKIQTSNQAINGCGGTLGADIVHDDDDDDDDEDDATISKDTKSATSSAIESPRTGSRHLDTEICMPPGSIHEHQVCHSMALRVVSSAIAFATDSPKMVHELSEDDRQQSIESSTNVCEIARALQINRQKPPQSPQSPHYGLLLPNDDSVANSFLENKEGSKDNHGFGNRGMIPKQNSSSRRQVINNSKKESTDISTSPSSILDIPVNADRLIRKCYRRKFCLCLGVNDYKYWPKLRHAKGDAMGLASFLQSELGFRKTILTEINVSKDKIEREILDKFASILQPDDLFVLSFHGHGHTKKIGDVDQGFLVPASARQDSNADLISMKSLRSWLEYLPCRHTLVVLDCCFSGLSACLRGRADSSAHVQMVNDHLLNCARLVINAGTKDQMVSDSGWGGNHSVFTGALMACPSLRDGIGSALGLFQWLQFTVSAHSAQTPTIGVLPGHEGGDIFLGLPSQKELQLGLSRQSTAYTKRPEVLSEHHDSHRKQMETMRRSAGLQAAPVLSQKANSSSNLKRHRRGLSF